MLNISGIIYWWPLNVKFDVIRKDSAWFRKIYGIGQKNTRPVLEAITQITLSPTTSQVDTIKPLIAEIYFWRIARD